MNAGPVIPRKIAILVHPALPEAIRESRLVQQYLTGEGLEVSTGKLDDLGFQQRILDGEFELLIVMGGDGAMLHAGRVSARADIPLLGINFGRFGFLIEIQPDNWQKYLPRLLTGNYRYETRMMLCTELWRDDEKVDEWQVLNEVVVCRELQVKPLQLSASVDGIPLTTYVADGLIASTPTGSTAYALAAGGPIMPPELRNILLVPIAPHLSINQAIILAEGARVSITVSSSYPAILSVDGQEPVIVREGDRVVVYAGNRSVRFIRFEDVGYFYRNLLSHMEHNPTTGKR